MEKHRRLIRVLWFCAFLLSFLLLGVARAALALSNGLFIGLWLALAVLLLLSSLVINMLWYQEFVRSVQALSPLLDTDPDQYIAAIGALLKGKRAEANRALLRLQLFEAYSRKGDYRSAKAQLTALRPQKLKRLYRLLYDLYLALACFHLGERGEALSILAPRADALTQYQQDPNLGPLISTLREFSAEPPNSEMLEGCQSIL